MGHRCGYVAIPPEHKFNETEIQLRKFAGRTYKHYDYDSLNISCHGGLTFMERESGIKEALLSKPCNDFWIGFDCGHCYDAPDREAYIKYYEDLTNEYVLNHPLMGECEIRNYDYVEKQCKNIIEQLIAA